MRASAAAASPEKPEPHSVGFNLLVIAMLVALAATGVAYVLDAASRAARDSRAGTVSRTLGGTELAIPAGWLREDVDRTEGFARQVRLAVSLPLGPQGAARDVDITLMPRSQVRPSSSLLDGVYLHQFTPEQASGPAGLVGKPLLGKDGFAGETVWYDPLSPAPFVAKCAAPLAEGRQGRCLRTLHLGPGMAAIYGFDADVLGNWSQFDALMHPVLERIGAH